MFWSAKCLPSDVRESDFILLLSTAGCWKQWPFSRFLVALSPGSVCFFSPFPFSTALAQKGQSRVTEQSCLQLSVANRVYVMYWTSSTRKKKKTLTRSNATFQSKVNMRPMIGCIWHKKKYVLPVDQVRRLRYQLHFLLKATRLSWG